MSVEQTSVMYRPLWRSSFLMDFYRAVLGNFTEGLTSNSSTINDDLEKAALPDEIFAARVGINGIGGTTVAIFGIICNVIAIIVLANYRHKSSAPFLLIILAVFDTIALFSEMVLETLTLLSRGGLITRKYFDGIVPVYVVMYPVPHVANTGSIYMTVLITVERFIAVVTPFRAMRYCNRRMAMKTCLVVFVWTLIYHIPMYMAYTYQRVWSDKINATKILFNRTEFGTSFFYNEVYVTWINFCLDFLVPFIIIAIMNVLILNAMRKRKEFVPCEGRQQTRENQDTRMTAMVLAVTAVFFVCHLFSAVAFMMMRGLNKFSECSLACNNFTAVADTMIMVNSAVNFILYCVVGKQFREIFVKVFCGYKKPKAPATCQTELSSQSQSSKAHNVVLQSSVAPNNQNITKRNIPPQTS